MGAYNFRLAEALAGWSSWNGTLRCHVFGKSGEAFFATGFLPALRSAVGGDKGRIVYHVHEQYRSVIDGAQFRPDAIETYPRRPLLSLAEDVNELIYGCQRRGRYWIGPDSDMNISMFYENLMHATDEPFYRQNMRSLGVGDRLFVPPRLASPPEDGPRIALVLPTGNRQTVIGRLPIPLKEWDRLASLCRARGLLPVARGHTEDPAIEMPGWDWAPSADPLATLRLGTRAAVVVGLNTGMLFAMTQVSPGHVTMLNPHPYRYFAFEGMIADGVINPARHHQKAVKAPLSPADAIRLVEEGLTR